MSTYTHELTGVEQACGVTLEQVAEQLPRVLMNGDRIIVDGKLPPALSGSVARCAAGGERVELAGFNALGDIVYRVITE